MPDSLPRISTRRGDTGMTSLYTGERVMKTDPRFHVIGNLDYCVSLLSRLRRIMNEFYGTQIETNYADLLISDIFRISTEICSFPVMPKDPIDSDSIQRLENYLKTKAKVSNKIISFIVPGADEKIFLLEQVRCHLRESERYYHELDFTKSIPNVGIYLNRASDLVWLMARVLNCEWHIVNEDENLPSLQQRVELMILERRFEFDEN